MAEELKILRSIYDIQDMGPNPKSSRTGLSNTGFRMLGGFIVP